MMISRVAENCFWLGRYVERADTFARILAVNRLHILDSDLQEGRSWKPVVIVSGEQKRFEELLGAGAYEDVEKSEEYLTWDERNAASIFRSFSGARENARTTREVVSREVWETINSAWRWLNEAEARREYNKDRQQFFARIRSTCAEFHGHCHDTMLHEEAFNFLRLGAWIERAGQTARIMDVKHHWLVPRGSAEYESPQESAQWMGLLRLCSAVEPFFKRHISAPTGSRVVQFLLQDAGFPRSVLYSLTRVEAYISSINVQANAGQANATQRLAQDTVQRLGKADFRHLSGEQLHQTLTEVIEASAAIYQRAADDYFDIQLDQSEGAGRQTESA